MRELRARGEADFQLQQRLFQLVGGDRNEAERLVARQRFGTEWRYSEDFYWSLAIEEVEKSEKD